jgi:imidazolonepropionase-like amidohydrolase
VRLRLGFLVLAAIAWPRSAEAALQDQTVALVNATVVDVEKGVVVPGRTVLTRGGRIQLVGPPSARLPAGTRRVDLGGQYVIPGLWDMHVHVANIASGAPADVLVQYFGALFVSNGVTGVRDAGGDAKVLGQLESTASTMRAAMPRLVFAGDKIGPEPNAKWSIGDVRAAIAARRKEGASFIKFKPGYPVELFRETLAECSSAAVQCVAHVPPADTSVWFPLRNRGSLEHLFSLTEHVSRLPAARMFTMAREYNKPTILQRVLYKLRLRKRPAAPEELEIAVRDTTRDQAFFGRMAGAGLWVTPTLLLHHYITRTDVVPSAAIDSQLALATLDQPQRTRALSQRIDGTWKLWMGLVRAMHTAGVQMLAGTDFLEEHVPGASLQAELVLLQRAGVPAPDVLRMATLNPAIYLGAGDSLGQVAAGRVADLVVLRQNPLDDISHVSGVAMVMVRGRLYDRRGLDSLDVMARTGLRELRKRVGR